MKVMISSGGVFSSMALAHPARNRPWLAALTPALLLSVAVFVALGRPLRAVGETAAADTARYAGHGQLVEDTRAASLKKREQSLRGTIAKDHFWIGGPWGECIWTLSALYLNERVEEANARLLARAAPYLERTRAQGEIPAPTPEQPGDAPWTFFSLGDYVRILGLFHAHSPHFPGRLKPETETAMKEALWHWVSSSSRVADTGPDDLLFLLGTENHDLCIRPNQYLVAALLLEDPVYKNRTLADGHTLAEHVAAHTAFFRAWPGARAKAGLWIEVGSDGYQKYSWPALFNLHELAPDPVIRKRFGLLLDLAFVEEAQISVRGYRGGGRSRAYYGRGNFESYKNLLYAPEGQGAKGTHSAIIETSRYQLPAEAILLRYRTFPAEKPFVIRNRVLGELAPREEGDGNRMAADSALVNYAYRTPHYLLGSTLQNPALTRTAADGSTELKYSGISRQNRAGGMIFDDPASAEICSVFTVVEKGRGGRPQHPFWSVQHENVLLIQRIAPHKPGNLGSYSTDRVGIAFRGKGLEKSEEGGWIFASNGKAFAAVKFLDGGYEWDEKREVANPAHFNSATDSTRILLHAGDVAGHESFDAFKAVVLNTRLSVSPDQVIYRFGPDLRNSIEAALYHPKARDRFTLPLVNGQPIELRPGKTYRSPFLNGDFGSERITVTVGPVERVHDFGQ